MLTRDQVHVPADVPESKKQDYITNYLRATRHTGNLMLFAGDQKIEHLNDDFYGTITVQDQEVPIPLDDANPEHLFKIASQAQIGVFATQLGLIARYGPSFQDIAYVVKLNSKTNLVKKHQQDPQSHLLWSIEDVAEFKKESGLNIVGVGYTVYAGSEHEPQMLREAARVALEAHKNGLLAIFWMYPRGKAVSNEKDPHLVAGAAGVGACLGADFVKVNYPKHPDKSSEEAFKEAVTAAGKTKVITAGGSSKGIREFLQETWNQINVSGCSGNATGRNIHQKPLLEAVNMANAIASITLGRKDVDFAEKVANGEERFNLSAMQSASGQMMTW